MIKTTQQQFIDSVFGIRDLADPTKLGQFDASAISTGIARLLAFPNASGTIALEGWVSDNFLSLDGTTGPMTGTLDMGDNPIVNVGGITPDRLLYGDVSKDISSVANLQSWIAGTTNQVNTADDGDGSITLSIPQDIHTGASPTFADLTLTNYDSSKVISEILAQTISPGVLETVTVTDDGGTDISWSAGEIIDFAGNIVSVDAGSATLANDLESHLYWETGTTLQIKTSSETSVQIPVAHMAVAAGDIWEIHEESLLQVLLHDIQHGIGEAIPLLVAEGLVVQEDTDATNPLDVSISAGEYYHEIHAEHSVAAMDSRTTPMRRWYHSGGVWTNDTNAQINNTQYDNGTALTAMSNNKYFRSLFMVTEAEIHWIYPQEQFNTLTAALNGNDPIIPIGLSSFPRCTVVIMQEGDTAFPTAGGDQWIDVRPTIGSAAGTMMTSVTDHGSLSGLGDDDHTQYLLVDGTRVMSGTLKAPNGVFGDTSLSNDNELLVGDIAGSAIEVIKTWSTSNNQYSQLRLEKSHAASEIDVATTTGEELGGIFFYGIDSDAAQQWGARIRATQDGAALSGIVPSNVSFLAAATTGVVERMSFEVDGSLKLNPEASGAVTLFEDSIEGDTETLQLKGFPSGGASDVVNLGFDATTTGKFNFTGAGDSYSFDNSIVTSDAVYFGGKTTDGSWRFIKSGNDLNAERRESGVWVDKGGFTA